MHALAVGAFALLAFATPSRAQVVAPDDGPGAQPQQPYPQQPQYPQQPPQPYPQQPQYPQQPPPYAAPQQYSAPPGYVLVPAAPTMSEPELAALESRSRTLRAVGAVLIVLGAVADIVGLALIIDYYGRSPFDNSHDWEPYTTLGLGFASAALLGAGIPVLTAGIRDARRAKHLREGRVAVAPTGLSVTF